MQVLYIAILWSIIATSAYAEANSLLVPLVKQDEDYILFEEGNKWLSSWQEAGFKNLALPFGDLDDILMFKPGELVVGDAEVLEYIYTRYSVEKVLIAILEKKDFDNKVILINAGEESPFLSFMHPVGDNLHKLVKIVHGRINNVNINPPQDENEETELQLGMQPFYDQDTLWLSFQINFGLKEWLEIQDMFQLMDEIIDMRVSSLQYNRVDIFVKIIDQESFLMTLKENGFHFVQEGNYIALWKE